MTLWRRLRRDQRGAAAVEFAILAPVMIALYFGLVETSEAVLAERKADHAASAIGDLVAQSSGTLTSSDLADIVAIGQTILSPFSTSGMQVRISSFTPNSAGTPAVTWSYSSGMTKLSPGTTKTMPITVAAGDSVIYSELKYTFNSPLQFVLPNALTFNEAYYLRPRQTSQITCTDC